MAFSYDVNIPGKGTFTVDSPSELTAEQAYQYAMQSGAQAPAEPSAQMPRYGQGFEEFHKNLGNAAGGVLEGLGRGVVGMAGTLATAPGAAIGAALEGGSLGEIADAASGAGGSAMENAPRLFGDYTKTAEGMLGEFLMEKPMHLMGDAMVNAAQKPWQVGPAAAPAAALKGFADAVGIDSDALLRTTGERGTEAAMYLAGLGFLKGQKAAKPGAKLTVEQAELLRKRAEEQSQAQLEQFKQNVEALPYVKEPLPAETNIPLYRDREGPMRLQMEEGVQRAPDFVDPNAIPYEPVGREARVEAGIEQMGRVEPPATKEVTSQNVRRALQRKQGGAVDPAVVAEAFEEITKRVGRFTAGMLKPLVERLANDPIVGAGFQNKKTGDVMGPFTGHAQGVGTTFEHGWRRSDILDGFVTRSGEFLDRDTVAKITGARISEHMQKGSARAVMIDSELVEQPVQSSPFVDWMPEGLAEPVNLYRSNQAATERERIALQKPMTTLTEPRTDLLNRDITPQTREAKLNRAALNALRQKQGGGIDPSIFNAIVDKFKGAKANPVETRTEFEIFRDSLPDTYKDMAKALYDQQKKLDAEKAAQKNTNPNKAAAKLAGLDDQWAPDLRPYESVDFSAVEDTHMGKVGRLFNPGGSMVATKTQSPAIKWGVDWINGAKNRMEAHVYRILSDPDTGWLPTLKVMRHPDREGVMSVILENNGVKWLSPDELVNKGLTAEQIVSYEKYRENMLKIANDINLRRAEMGLKPMKLEPGYYPATWQGRYFLEVSTPDGRRVGIESSNRRGDIEDLKKQLDKVFKTSEVQERQPNYAADKGDFKYRPLFDQVAESLGRDSFERVAFDEIVDQFYADKGYSRRGFGKHMEKEKTGVRGYRGKRAHLSPLENYRDALGSIENYVRDAYDWIETQAAFKELSKFDADQKTAHLKNTKQYLREYWDHAQGTENALMRASRELIDFADHLFERLPGGGGIGTTDKIGRGIREVLMAKMLGGWRLSFLVPNRLQSIQMMPAAILEVRAREPALPYTHSSGMALTKGFLDSQAYQFGFKTDALVRDAMEYAEKSGIVHPRFMSEVRRSRDLSTGRNIWEWVSGLKGINAVEQMARMDAYLMAVRTLEGTRKGPQLFEAARNIVDQAMTNYRQHERAMVFQRAGLPGAMASPLQTFKFNYFGQQLKYLKLIADNPTAVRNYMPLVVSMASQVAFGGLTGLLLLKEVDLVLDLLKAKGLLDPNSDNATSWILKRSAGLQGRGRDLVRYGLWSSLTGAQASPHFALSQVIPHSVDDALSLPGAGWELAGDLIDSANALYKRTPRKAASIALQNLPGGPAKGLEEWSRTTPGGLLQNPEKGFEGTVERNPNTPDPYRLAGTRSIPEAEQMQAMQEQQKKDQIRDQRRAQAAETYIAQYLEGADAQQSLDQYIAMGGNPRDLVKQLVTTIEKSKMSAWKRRETKLNSIRQLKSYLESQEYGVKGGK